MHEYYYDVQLLILKFSVRVRAVPTFLIPSVSKHGILSKQTVQKINK